MYGLKCLRDNCCSELSPAGTPELSPGRLVLGTSGAIRLVPQGRLKRLGTDSAVPSGLAISPYPTQDWRPGLSSGVPAGLSSERWFSMQTLKPSKIMFFVYGLAPEVCFSPDPEFFRKLFSRAAKG